MILSLTIYRLNLPGWVNRNHSSLAPMHDKMTTFQINVLFLNYMCMYIKYLIGEVAVTLWLSFLEKKRNSLCKWYPQTGIKLDISIIII